MTRPVLDAGHVSPEARAKAATFHPDIVEAVRDAVAHHKVVVVGMGWNPHVGQARRALDRAGVPYTYLGYGNYLSKWKERLAIKLWSGWPTFPQVFINGTLVGGGSDLIQALDDGRFRALLDTTPAA